MFKTIRHMIRASRQSREARFRPPAAPELDISPFWADVAMGTGRHTAYTWPVNATTPSGLAVRWKHCCQRGHLSPDLAKKHAGRIEQRIALTGR